MGKHLEKATVDQLIRIVEEFPDFTAASEAPGILAGWLKEPGLKISDDVRQQIESFLTRNKTNGPIP